MTGPGVASAGTRSAARERFDVDTIREDFPILRRTVYGRPLVYLDNAATSQKPRSVIDAVTRYYESENSNIHRGVHYLSELATREYEAGRGRVQRFLGAASPSEIIFVRGTTEAINLVAASYGRSKVEAGDEILITWLEHHSNIVPWQLLCEQQRARLVVVPIDDRGDLRMDEFDRLLSPRTKIVAVSHISNALGTINPIERIVRRAHENGAVVLVDGAQAAPHIAIDVQKMDCDFYAISGHKMYAPTGVGVLYGKEKLLEAMPPYQGGGDMIRSVSFEKATYNSLPYKFEAGTPNVEAGIGIGAAIDYLDSIGLGRIAAHEQELLDYATRVLTDISGLRVIGTAREKASVLSFVLEGIHPHDIGTILDREGIAIRTGHHCAQPVMERFGVPATARASFAFYNTKAEIDALAAALRKVIEVFR